MESSNVISTDKATIIIQVNPQVAQDTVIGGDGEQARGAYHNTTLTEFFKAQPKALGAVQIMIGVTVFLFGIVRTTDIYNFPAVSMYYGITYWGSLVNISAGSVTVAAQNKPHPCVMKASLVMNVLSSIMAGLAILLMGIELGLGANTSKYRSCIHGEVRIEGFMCPYFERYDFGILGILLVFSILQFIISIIISAFACKATSSTDSTMINVALIGDTELQ